MEESIVGVISHSNVYYNPHSHHHPHSNNNNNDRGGGVGSESCTSAGLLLPDDPHHIGAIASNIGGDHLQQQDLLNHRAVNTYLINYPQVNNNNTHNYSDSGDELLAPPSLVLPSASSSGPIKHLTYYPSSAFTSPPNSGYTNYLSILLDSNYKEEFGKDPCNMMLGSTSSPPSHGSTAAVLNTARHLLAVEEQQDPIYISNPSSSSSLRYHMINNSSNHMATYLPTHHPLILPVISARNPSELASPRDELADAKWQHLVRAPDSAASWHCTDRDPEDIFSVVRPTSRRARHDAGPASCQAAPCGGNPAMATTAGPASCRIGNPMDCCDGGNGKDGYGYTSVGQIGNVSNPCNASDHDNGDGSRMSDDMVAMRNIPGQKGYSVLPQGMTARRRRHRISRKLKILRNLVVPYCADGRRRRNMDTASMLDAAIQRIEYLKRQIHMMHLQLAREDSAPATAHINSNYMVINNSYRIEIPLDYPHPHPQFQLHLHQFYDSHRFIVDPPDDP